MYRGEKVKDFMVSQLGNGGAAARKYVGIGAGEPWCCAEVAYAEYRCDSAKLFCNGRKVYYCPTAIDWCYANLADIPIYLALPGDYIFFDWEPNGLPNHIGFVKHRISDLEIETIEGNTSGGIVAEKKRPLYVKGKQQIQAVFRPNYPVPKSEYDTSKKLEVDGMCGFNTIACLQKVLGVKVDAILGKETVKALQKKAGTKADGSWGVKTTKAVQKMLGIEQDGYCYVKTVKALQKWINKQLFSTPIKGSSEQKKDPLQPWFDSMEEQYEWSKNQKYHFNKKPTVANSKKEGTCITFPAVSLQRIKLLKKGEYFYYNPDENKIMGTGASYVKKHPEIFELWYPHKTAKELKSILKKGDIVGYDNPDYHTMAFMGWRDGKPIFNTMGGGKRGLKVEYPHYADRKIDMIVRIRKIGK